jgi:CheY-like chemotaxis protein
MNLQEWYVLVVEDDPDGQEVVQRLLRHHGIRFDAAMDAETALELLDQHPYTAAVVDLALPAMDGWSLIKRIKSNPTTTDLPCVAITAFHSSDVSHKVLENGFIAYFPKPLDPLSFVQDMKRIVTSGN